MELLDVIKTLTGAITPVGDTQIDAQRQQNLEQLLETLDALIDDVIAVAADRRNHQASIQKAGKHAYNWLADLSEGVGEFLDRE